MAITTSFASDKGNLTPSLLYSISTKPVSNSCNICLLVYKKEICRRLRKGQSWKVRSVLLRKSNTTHTRASCGRRAEDSIRYHNRPKEQEIGGIKEGDIWGALEIRRHFCRRCFTTWNILLPSEELAVKLPGSKVSTKYIRLPLEYRGKRQIKVTVCNYN